MSIDHKELSIAFTGEFETISAPTLISALIAKVKVLQVAKQEIAPDLDLQIRVSPPRKGSFQYTLDLSMAAGSRGLFENDEFSVLTSITDVFKGALLVRKHLKGMIPQEILHAADGVAIQNVDGNVMVINRPTYNVLDRDAIDHALSESFRYLDKEPCVDGFGIDVGEIAVSFEQDAFSHMSAYGLLSGGSSETKFIEDRAYVHPVKFAIEDRYKWDVYYKGNKIAVRIKDESFFDRVQQGQQRFGKGDAMLVDLRIRQQYDNEIRAYINKSYEIINIIDYIARAEQLDLDIPPGGRSDNDREAS